MTNAKDLTCGSLVVSFVVGLVSSQDLDQSRYGCPGPPLHKDDGRQESGGRQGCANSILLERPAATLKMLSDNDRATGLSALCLPHQTVLQQTLYRCT
ncbi:hypothetical protein [Streptomyces sp. F001]|uniref:hypothetical protein n=1 Tax=Streptomyces sp. F001 TaxID=1510026 RepID=UPI00101E4BDD|nr:hypothetical protein [Streptomyces sp. F001]